MIIPQVIKDNFNWQALTENANEALCPAAMASTLSTALGKRNFQDEAKSGWNKCMDKKWCKIVAIVCIVIGCLIVLWLISIVCNVICCGVNMMKSCCWCCSDGCCNCCGRKNPPPPPPPPPPDSREKAYNNPNMYYHPQDGYANQQRYYYA